MKDTIKFFAMQLFVAIVVYFLLFALGGLRTFTGLLIVIAAIGFTIWFRRNVHSPWWLTWLEAKLLGILPGRNRGKRL